MSTTKKVLSSIIFVGLICYVVSAFFFQITIIHGDSMLPTLKDNQIVLIKKFANNYSVGDIIVFKVDGINGYVVKRIAKCEENDEYYVLGDNLDNSIDSRYSDFGLVKVEDVIGVVILL